MESKIQTMHQRSKVNDNNLLLTHTAQTRVTHTHFVHTSHVFVASNSPSSLDKTLRPETRSWKNIINHINQIALRADSLHSLLSSPALPSHHEINSQDLLRLVFLLRGSCAPSECDYDDDDYEEKINKN